MEHDDMLHWEKCSMAFTMARAEPAEVLRTRRMGMQTRRSRRVCATHAS